MNYVLVAGIGLVALGMIPATATGNTMGHRHHMKKEERREERRMRKEQKNHVEIIAPNTSMIPQPALPVMETYVPQDVVSKLESKYGSALYDITTLQSVNGVDRYCVRTLNNGVVEAVTVDGSGAPAM